MTPPIEAKISEQELLEWMGVSTMPGLFVLGSTEHRVTIYSQQCRALNLTHALSHTGALRKANGDPAHIAVLGAGIAGMTVSAGLAIRGAHVTILEQRSQSLTVQWGCHTRWIHPHIYDWPAPEWEQVNAELPILNWSANSAAEVSKRLRDQWHALIAHLQRVDSNRLVTIFNAQNILLNPRPQDKQWRLSWNAPGFGTGAFDLVILAIGFGEEMESPVSRSYWRDDDLHQEPQLDTLVSGCGDGGLTDVLRLCIRDFEHDQIQELLSGPWLNPIRSKIIQAESAALNESNRELADQRLTDFFINLSTPEVEDVLRARTRNLSKVVLNGNSDSPFSRNSAPLNRFLVSRLMRLGLGYLPGKLTHIEKDDKANKYNIKLERPDGTSDPLSYSRVVLRHGPATPRPIERFPSVIKNLNLTTDIARRLWFAADRTRWRMWRDDDFRRPKHERVASNTYPSSGLHNSIPSKSNIQPPSSSVLLGWTRLDKAYFLHSLNKPSTEQGLLSFFEGRDPTWRDINSGRLATRSLVGAVIKEVQPAPL